jgi:2-keto-4-pentenoate hydratase
MDPRIERGTRAMLALREQRLAQGERPLGWKVGFGSPAAFERLGTDRPLAGFMLRSGALPDGATVDISGWTNPALELEVAVHIGDDLGIGGV